MLQVNHLQLAYGPRLILDNVSFTVAAGEKAGLIGVNGAGKSSLLKIIGGYQEADRGKVMLPRTHGYLSQDVAHEAPVAAGMTIRDYFFHSIGLNVALDAYQKLSDQMATGEGDLEELLELFSNAQEDLERLGYYEADARAEQLIAGLNLKGMTLDREVLSLSGGQKTKLALAQLLFKAPELLMLDEPTNFLDADATIWLMEYLETYKGALVIISHDLDLLDKGITKVLRLNEFTHKLEEYKGNYTNYLKVTGDELALMERTKKQQDREVVRLRKTSERLRGFGATRVSQRIAVDRRIADLESSKPQIPQNSRKMKIDFPVRQQSSHLIIKSEALSKSYGSKEVFKNLNLEILRGQRLVIVGLNGVGKTTLLRCLLNQIPFNSGSITLGDRVEIGYYAQENEGLDYTNTVLNEATEIQPEDTKRVRSILGRFLFNGERVFQEIGTLSGGEKTRLALAKMVLNGPNLLVLDEPTSHLDVLSRNIIGEALGNYKGTIITVTHDVEFVRDLKPTDILLMPDGKLLPYEEKYDEMLKRA